MKISMASYIPPKRPYSLHSILTDILNFASLSLVPDGRLSFWLPTSNDADQEIKIPTHPHLELVSVCTQEFNKWSRRLITYRRLQDNEVKEDEKEGERGERGQEKENGVSADDLNPFRRGYFQGFKAAFR